MSAPFFVKRNRKPAADVYAIASQLAAHDAVAETEPQEIQLKSVDLESVQDEIRRTVAQGAVAIVQNAVERAKEGSQFQLIKFLFEIAGLYPVAPKSGDTKELSLARMLCRQLGLPESPELESKTGSTDGELAHPTKLEP